jgi:hypothetical protein
MGRCIGPGCPEIAPERAKAVSRVPSVLFLVLAAWAFLLAVGAIILGSWLLLLTSVFLCGAFGIACWQRR